MLLTVGRTRGSVTRAPATESRQQLHRMACFANNWRFGFTIASSRESRKLSVDCRQESDNIAACTNLEF